MTKAKREAVQFFMTNGGYCTPPGRVACAKQAAQAEQTALEQGWEATWENDDSGCSGCDCESKDCACSSGEPHETLGCVLRDKQGKVLASLWGICGATKAYMRVVEAELASEAVAELEAAKGEKRWEATCAIAG